MEFLSGSIVKQNGKCSEKSFTFLIERFKDLVEKSGCPNMNMRKERTLSGYMNDIFKLRNTDRLTGETWKFESRHLNKKP